MKPSGSIVIASAAVVSLIVNGGAGQCVYERDLMPKKGAIAFMLMLTGLIGYLLFDSMGIMGGVLTAGLFYMGLGLKHFAGIRHAEVKSGGKRIRIHLGRQRRQAEALEKKARLEALRARAYLLADACRDSYGAQRCCLEIIGLAGKEDPLFMEACELYMHTVSTQSQRARASRPPSTSNGCQFGVKQAPATANVIPFPLTAGPI